MIILSWIWCFHKDLPLTIHLNINRMLVSMLVLIFNVSSLSPVSYRNSIVWCIWWWVLKIKIKMDQNNSQWWLQIQISTSDVAVYLRTMANIKHNMYNSQHQMLQSCCNTKKLQLLFNMKTVMFDCQHFIESPIHLLKF